MKTLLAKTAYEGYHAHLHGVSLATGSPIAPDWDGLPDGSKDAWVAAITAVQEVLSEAVKKEIEDAGFTIRERLTS